MCVRRARGARRGTAFIPEKIQQLCDAKLAEFIAQMMWRRQVLIYYRNTLLESEGRQDRCCRSSQKRCNRE